MDSSDIPASIELSIVVPCYNEYECLKTLHDRVVKTAHSVVGNSFELILVNDGSTDNTWLGIQQLVDANLATIGVNLARNYGHQIALSAGLETARGARVFVIDADLQDPPELLADMMKLMDEGHDVVFGQRASRQGETRFKLATAKMFYRVLNHLSDVHIPVDTGDFRLMSRRVVDVLNAMPEQHRFIRGMVSWIGFSQVPISYERDERVAGTSHYPFRKMFALATNAITSFSVVPLRLASHLALLFAAGGLAMLAYVLSSYFAGETIHGWTSLTALVLILGSVQLMMLGIFGEYIGRLYMEGKRRPMFVIERIAKGSSSVISSPAIELQTMLKERANER
jgi:dolichol-phosphate mannosyltransferase